MANVKTASWFRMITFYHGLENLVSLSLLTVTLHSPKWVVLEFATPSKQLHMVRGVKGTEIRINLLFFHPSTNILFKETPYSSPLFFKWGGEASPMLHSGLGGRWCHLPKVPKWLVPSPMFFPKNPMYSTAPTWRNVQNK